MERVKDHCLCGQLVIGTQQKSWGPTGAYVTTRYYCPCGRQWSTSLRLDETTDPLTGSAHEPVTIHVRG